MESLLEYLENYALRVRPLLDVNEVSVIMMMILVLFTHRYITLLARRAVVEL